MYKIKHYLIHENKVNENIIIVWGIKMWNNEKKKVVFLYVKLQTYRYFKLDYQKVDQYTGSKWLIHGTKIRKYNQLQSLELPSRIS